MTLLRGASIVKFMRHLGFPALILAGAAAVHAARPARADAQQVPGRDLLEFPIGTVAEAPAFARQTGDGFWNPALVALPEGTLFRVGAAALVTPPEQGVAAHMIGVSVGLPDRTTVGLSVVRASIADLVATASDPQSIDDLPYSTIVASLSAARRQHRHVVIGGAIRYRVGELDGVHGTSVGVDGGVLADGLTRRDVRVALSTFLWQPANAQNERTRYSVASDVRVLGADERREARAGYAFAYTEGLTREHYGFAAGRHGAWEGRVGVAHVVAYDDRAWRMRLGLGLHYARYVIGIARDENGAGLKPIYQFTLSALIPRD